MKLFNPTPLQILAKCGGITYVFEPSEVKTLVDEVGSHLMLNHQQHGMVELKLTSGDSKQSKINYIITKTLEGLDKFREHINYVLEQYVSLDTELKAQNQYGTILNHKNVRYWTKMLQDVGTMISDIEAKYSISITQEESKIRSEVLMSSIDDIVKKFDADSENQNKTIKQEKEFDQLLADVIPKDIIKRSKEARI